MGTAQLLYITLGMIIIGIAIVVGMDMFETYYQENNREQLINHSVTLLTMAEEYYKKPVDLGGGGGSYKDFSIPESMTRNEYGRFNINTNNNRVNINARGIADGRDGEDPVRITARIVRNRRNPQGNIQILIRN